MPATITTIPLTNLGTIACQLGAVGSVAVGSDTASPGFAGAFPQGSPEAKFVTGGLAVHNTYLPTEGQQFNTTFLPYVNLNNSSPLTVDSSSLSPTIGGAVFSLETGVTTAQFFGTDVVVLNERTDSAGGIAERGLSLDSLSNGTLTAYNFTSGYSEPAFPPYVPPGYPVYESILNTVTGLTEVHLCYVLGVSYDTSYGVFFDATAASDTIFPQIDTVQFFPQLNGEGIPSPYGDIFFNGGFTDSISQQSFWVCTGYSSVSPFPQLPNLVEVTQAGNSIGLQSFTFNNSAIPGDIFSIAGNTPNGFYFVNGATLVEVNPVAQTYTTFTFTPNDTLSSACYDAVFGGEAIYSAHRTTNGNWWFTNALPTGTQTEVLFAQATVGGGTQETILLQSAAGTLGGTVELSGLTNYGPAQWMDVSLDNGQTWTPMTYYETASGTYAASWAGVGPILTPENGV